MGLSLGTASSSASLSLSSDGRVSLSLFSDQREEETAAAVAVRTSRRPKSSTYDAIFTCGIGFGVLVWLSLQNNILNRRPPSQPEARTVDKISVTIYSNTKGGRDSESCAICLEKFAAGEKVCALSPCKHTFHNDCFSHWIRSKRTCPLCRARVL